MLQRKEDVTNVKSYLSARLQLWIYYVYHRTVRDWHERSPAIKRVVKLSHCLCHVTRQTFTRRSRIIKFKRAGSMISMTIGLFLSTVC